MRTEELSWSQAHGWRRGTKPCAETSLVLYFGPREVLATSDRFDDLRRMFPAAHLLGCSTGGQIHGDDLVDDSVAALAMHFDNTRLAMATTAVDAERSAYAHGEDIGRQLAAADLAGVFVVCDGTSLNGGEFVAGITAEVGQGVVVTGGMAGDGTNFTTTIVGGNAPPRTLRVAAVGFYGSAIKIGCGVAAGWDGVGPRRRITRSSGPILFELDGQPALDLYEKYIGPEEAAKLPGSGLLFPFRIYNPLRPDHDIVRNVMYVDREARSITFAGDVPRGWQAQLLTGTLDRLAEGAADAVRQAITPEMSADGAGSAAILVSCVGRRMVMGQRVIDEVDAATEQLGPNTSRVGFYAYGELSPHDHTGTSELHNQTMTITTFTEAA